MKSLVLTAMMLGAVMMPAQDVHILPIPGPGIVSPYAQLKEYLALSDTQVAALQQVQQLKADAEGAIYRQMSEKQRALSTLLESATADAFQVGRLTLDIRELQKRLPISGEPYRTTALNVLTAAQKTKLPSLTSAMQLMGPANEAVWIGLIDGPVRAVPLGAVFSGVETKLPNQ